MADLSIDDFLSTYKEEENTTPDVTQVDTTPTSIEATNIQSVEEPDIAALKQVEDIDKFLAGYNEQEADVQYPTKEELKTVPSEPTVETPSVSTQYMMGLLSKVNDPDTHMTNALRVFRKNNYDIVGEPVRVAGQLGMPDTYKYKLKKWKDAEGNEISPEEGGEFWLDEASFTQAVWNEVGDVGEYTGAVAGGVIGKTPTSVAIGKTLGNTFDQWLSHMVTGEELSAEGRAKEVGKTALLSVAELTGYKVGEKVVGAVKAARTPSYFSKEAQTIMKDLGLDERTAMSMVEGYPKADQAKIIAQQSGGKGAGYMKQAITDSDTARLKYLDELTARKKAVEETAGKADFTAIKRDTSNEYGAMKKYASTVEIPGEGYDLKNYSGVLQDMSEIARTDAAKTRITAVSKQLEEHPINNLEDLIDLRQVINYEYSKADSVAKKKWSDLKDNLDTYMKKSVSPEDLKIVDDSIASYARMKNQEEVLELIEGASKGLGKGAKVGEVGAIDWNKLQNTIKESGLSSPEVDNVLKVTKSFSEKFGDMDSALFSAATPQGTKGVMATLTDKPQQAGRVLAVRRLVDWTYRQLVPELKAQHAITKAIERSDTQADFVLNVIKNENTPSVIKSRFKEIAVKNNLNRNSVNRKKFLSRKAIEETKRLQDKVQKTGIQMDKKDMAINAVDARISTLQGAYNRRKTQAGKATIQQKINIQNKKRELLQKEKEMISRDHADYTKKYEGAAQKVEELSLFETKKAKGTVAAGVGTTTAYPSAKEMKAYEGGTREKPKKRSKVGGTWGENTLSWETGYSRAENKTSSTLSETTYNKLASREGIVDKTYKDTEGKPTAGIGHLLTDAEKKRYPVGTKIPKTQIDKWFEQDTRKARNAAKLQAKEIGEPKLEEALIHVNFQLGTNWKSKFKETYPLLKQGKYNEAIANLKESKWMKQTPKRVNDFIQEIEKLT